MNKYVLCMLIGLCASSAAMASDAFPTPEYLNEVEEPSVAGPLDEAATELESARKKAEAKSGYVIVTWSKHFAETGDPAYLFRMYNGEYCRVQLYGKGRSYTLCGPHGGV